MDLPESIKAHLIDGSWTRITIGHSRAKTFRIDRPGAQSLFLKVAGRGELTAEKERTEWLGAYVSVPHVVAFHQNGDRDFLLVTAISGRDASRPSKSMLAEQLVTVLAHGLRHLHSVPTRLCPFDMRLDVQIAQALHNLRHDLVDFDDLDEVRQGWTGEQLAQALVEKRPADEDMVVTHGDFCLPNTIIDDGVVSGFIDLGRAGVADRYQDIALVIRSIQWNLNRPDLTDVFLKAYGITDPDWSKIEYYQLLDEFF